MNPLDLCADMVWKTETAIFSIKMSLMGLFHFFEPSLRFITPNGLLFWTWSFRRNYTDQKTDHATPLGSSMNVVQQHAFFHLVHSAPFVETKDFNGQIFDQRLSQLHQQRAFSGPQTHQSVLELKYNNFKNLAILL